MFPELPSVVKTEKNQRNMNQGLATILVYIRMNSQQTKTLA